MKIGIGLYGINGHQVHKLLEGNPDVELVATAAFDLSWLSEAQKNNPGIVHYDTLEQMLKDNRVQLVSLCSPRRRDQPADAIQCLESGRHVYAEKPCAFTEDELNAIIETSARTGMKFHEMAGTAFEQPYLSMREIVKNGTIGEVIQVFAQKSYPYFDRRPQDEDVDGGLTRQAGIHAFRFIEHVAGQKITNVYTIETKLGNPVVNGELRRASSLVMKLENGGVASMIVNYLNYAGFGKWGNEHLRIFGTKGFIESTDAGERTRLVVGETDFGAIEQLEPSKDYFDYYIDSLCGKGEMPVSIDDELHPALIAIRAKINLL